MDSIATNTVCPSSHDATNKKQDLSNQIIQEDKEVFRRKVKLILDPYSSAINAASPRIIKMLETLASAPNEISKSNYDRIITMFSNTPKEKEKPLLNAFDTFLKKSRIVSEKNDIPIIIKSIIKRIEAEFATNTCTERNNAIAKQQLNEEQPLREKQLEEKKLEKEKEEKKLEEEQRLLRHQTEKSAFLKILNSHITDADPSGFITDLDYNRVMGFPLLDRNGNSGLVVNYAAGIVHNEGPLQLKNNISSLMEALHLNNSDTQYSQHGNSRIKCTLHGNDLLSIYALPKDGHTVFKCLKPEENILTSLDKEAQVEFNDYKAFYVFSHCLRTGDTHYKHSDLTIDNLIKFDVMEVTGNKELLDDIQRIHPQSDA